MTHEKYRTEKMEIDAVVHNSVLLFDHREKHQFNFPYQTYTKALSTENDFGGTDTSYMFILYLSSA